MRDGVGLLVLGGGLLVSLAVIARAARAARRLRLAPTPLRWAIVNVADSEKWHDLPEIFRRAFAPPSGQAVEWHEYRAWLGELPAPEAYDGIIISGSARMVTDEPSTPWMQRLSACIRAATRHERVRVVGVCFGHQIVAHALGGRVGPNPAPAPFAFGVEQLRCTPGWHAHPAVRRARECTRQASGSAALPDTPRVLESHGQCVLELPPGAEALASSSKCPCEAYALGERVLCMQFHPEFWPAVMRERIEPSLRESGSLDADGLAAAAASFEAYTPADAAFVRALVVAFLLGKSAQQLSRGRGPRGRCQ